MKEVNQPQRESEQALSDIINDAKTYVEVRGKQWGLRYLKNGTKRKITTIMLNDKEDEDKVSTKVAACLRLNNFWGIALLYPILWRWMYYVSQYTDNELVDFIAEGKKKVGAEAYLMTTMLLTGMKDTIMMMTRKEVEHIQAEQLLAAHGQSEKNIEDSPNH